MGWDPRQYLKFSGERLRPGFDLLAQVDDELPEGPICELGCGTGVHARAMAERWPGRPVIALDKSASMLKEAGAEASSVRWVEGDIEAWSAPTPAGLIFSTATLQWLEGHERLFPRLMRELGTGGVLAVQMPRNFDAPSHVLLRETAMETRWSKARPGEGETMPLRTDPVRGPTFYYDLLRPLARELELWETEYLHVLEGEDPVLEWVRGSALRPVLEALGPDEARAFEARYGAKLRAAYPRRADGHTLLPFRRIFMVART